MRTEGAYVRWSEDFATGIETIDGQHRWLFTTTADFGRALDEGRGASTYGLLLQMLEAYTLAHFRHEERCMEERRCPAAARNREAHRRFRRVLERFAARYRRVGFRAHDARRLVRLLESWLAHHICRIDIRLRDPAPARP